MAAVSAPTGRRLHDFRLRANELEAWGAVFFICVAAGLEGRTIGGTKRSAIFVEAHISGRQTSAGIERDNGFLKSVTVQQKRETIIT